MYMYKDFTEWQPKQFVSKIIVTAEREIERETHRERDFER